MENKNIFVHSSYTEVNKITAQISIYRNNNFRGYFDLLIPNPITNKIPYLVIIAKGYENPTDWTYETYTGINNFLMQLKLDIKDFEIYVDLYNFLGPYEDYIFKWNLNVSDDSIQEELVKLSKNGLTFDFIQQIEELHDC
ncbi:hypothetical protein AB1282_04685 [Gottfriedia sp. S16(2024)]|uniref:hypothetical protein n=1 Tax=Gottfriedia sp. S16(2024) TaxID=3162883 RepID=UPI003D24DBFC